ncbi:hypothetical protein NE237_010719 [Protea cynaroides]|uniref:Uncharacterized protein n=1 Tax=Protea cynaroides TaxID=273540 RepID=A0A9Q0L092_9MAGN|nr:hypothetical protein NE237_010719 [Protea cynaroides]
MPAWPPPFDALKIRSGLPCISFATSSLNKAIEQGFKKGKQGLRRKKEREMRWSRWEERKKEKRGDGKNERNRVGSITYFREAWEYCVPPIVQRSRLRGHGIQQNLYRNKRKLEIFLHRNRSKRELQHLI